MTVCRLPNAQAADTARRLDVDAAENDCACRTVCSLTCASADDDGFGLIEVHRQTVDVEPVLYCAETVLE